MSRPSERLRRLGRHLAALFTGPAAGPRGFTPREGRGVRDEGRVGPLVRLTPHPSPLAPGTGAAPGREGDGPPRRPADAAPRQGEAAAPAREAAAGTPAAGTPEGATPAADAAPEAAARSEPGPGARAHPAAAQDPPEDLSPAEVRRGIARPSRRTGEGVAEPPSRVAAPRHGPLGDLGDRVDHLGDDPARIAQQLVHLSDQARAAWRAAQEVTRQLQQVNRSALKR